MAHGCRDDRRPKAGGDAHADATDGTANGDVPNHVFLAMPWRNGVSKGRERKGEKLDLGPK